MQKKCEKTSVSGDSQEILVDLEMWIKNAEMAIFTFFVKKHHSEGIKPWISRMEYVKLIGASTPK
jgi:hypothetical protein